MKELGYYIISADLCGIAPYRREIFYKKTLLNTLRRIRLKNIQLNFITEMELDGQVG